MMGIGLGVSFMTMNQTNARGKTTIPAKKALQEMLSERFSKTENLDPSRSHLNEYHTPDGVDDGEQMTQWLLDQFDAANAKLKHEHKRPMPRNTVLGSTIVLKPDMDSINAMSREQQDKFLHDCVSAFSKWLGYTPDCWAIHRDEAAPHVHIADRILDENGRFASGRRITRSSLRAFHKTFIADMKAYGWDVEPHKSEAEHENDGDVPKPAGMSANAYAAYSKHVKAADAKLAQAQQLMSDAQQLKDAADKQTQDNDRVSMSLKKREDKLKDDTADLQQRENDITQNVMASLEPTLAAIEKRQQEQDEKDARLSKKRETLSTWQQTLHDQDAQQKVRESQLDERHQQVMDRLDEVDQLLDRTHYEFGKTDFESFVEDEHPEVYSDWKAESDGHIDRKKAEARRRAQQLRNDELLRQQQEEAQRAEAERRKRQDAEARAALEANINSALDDHVDTSSYFRSLELE